MKGNILACLVLVVEAIYMVAGEHNKTTPAAVNQTTFKPDLSRHMFSFKFRVSVELPYTENRTVADLKVGLSDKLLDAYKGSPGLAYINITDSDIHQHRTGATSNISCQYVVSFNANTSIVKIRTDIVNRVIGNIETENFFIKFAVHNLKVNRGEMTAMLTIGQDNETCKVARFTPCPPEYVCVDLPYLHCVHQCQHGTNKRTCENGGHCFFDVPANKTKCSCGATDKYIYSGNRCEQKVEKLALKPPFIIAIAAGGGGAIILILIIVIVVLTCRGDSHGMTNKESTQIRHDENGYAMTSIVRETNVDEDTRRYSKLSLDGVSNALYAQPSDTRYLAGRNHAVYKDDSGQEIYMYQPVSERDDRNQPASERGDRYQPASERGDRYQPASERGDRYQPGSDRDDRHLPPLHVYRGDRSPSRQSSFDDDGRSGRPFSYHGSQNDDYRQNRRPVSKSYI